MSIVKTDINACCGCKACGDVCPKGAIRFTHRDGFEYPTVDEALCVGCDLCEKVCVALSDAERYEMKTVKAAYHNDTDVRADSQSGGAFSALAEQIYSVGGVVYGASLCDDKVTRHIRTEDESELPLLRGSKYVQSNMQGVYSMIKKDLKDEKTVLFCGTPCQNAALKQFVQTSRLNGERLIFCDIVCYGVPSPAILSDWLSALERTKHSRIKAFEFRQRSLPWGESREKYVFENGKVLEGYFFLGMYFDNLIIRPSCHSCRYCNTVRPGDVTVGDFWGAGDVFPELDTKRGLSLISANTEKGEELLSAASEKLTTLDATLDEAMKGQPRISGAPTEPSPRRDEFISLYNKKGIKKAMTHFGKYPRSFTRKVLDKLAYEKNKLLSRFKKDN